MLTRQCKNCGKDYQNRLERVKNCSRSCGISMRNRTQIKKLKVNCKTCGKEIETFPSAKRKYCSLNCAYNGTERNETLRQAASGQNNPWFGKKRPEHAKLMKEKNTLVLNGINKYWLGKKRSLENREKLRRANLGKTLSEEHKQKLSDARKGKLLGEKAWNWKGGENFFLTRIRGCYKNKEWRAKIFVRDNFTCQMCGQRGGYKEADHFPQSFSSIIKEYGIKTLEQALECEKLWDISNGRTLCYSCHKTTFKK